MRLALLEKVPLQFLACVNQWNLISLIIQQKNMKSNYIGLYWLSI